MKWPREIEKGVQIDIIRTLEKMKEIPTLFSISLRHLIVMTVVSYDIHIMKTVYNVI